MSVFDKEISAEIAFAKVEADGTVLTNRGFASIVSGPGPGEYVLTREAGGSGAAIDAAVLLSYPSLNGTAAGSITTEDSVGPSPDENTATRVRTFNAAGAPADMAFTISQRVPTNQDA